MIPLRDNVPTQRFPFVNYAILGVTLVVFVAQLLEPEGAETLIESYGMIPARVFDPDRPIVIRDLELRRTVFGDIVQVPVEREAQPPAIPPWLTLLSSIFLHGGWMHFFGNTWFLYIFGDNVEDRFGHLGYLVFYLAAGVAAGCAHLLSSPHSMLPTIGASGAIAGVMGAYFLLYPRAMVLTLVPLIIIFEILVLPAPIFLGIWFVLQFFQGTFAVGSTEAGGVAWWAHIGGFAAGVLVAYVLRKRHALLPKDGRVRANTDHIGHYRINPW